MPTADITVLAAIGKLIRATTVTRANFDVCCPSKKRSQHMKLNLETETITCFRAIYETAPPVWSLPMMMIIGLTMSLLTGPLNRDAIFPII